MIDRRQKKLPLFHILAIIGFVLPAIIPVESWVSAQNGMKYFSNPHFISTSEFGVTDAQGMVFSPEANAFLVWGASQNASLISIYEDVAGKMTFSENGGNPLGAAYDNHSRRLFRLGTGNQDLLEVEIQRKSSNAVRRFSIGAYQLQNVGGMSFDPATGRLFMLDAGKSQMLIVTPQAVQGLDGDSAVKNNRIDMVNLESVSKSVLRGLAFNPSNGHVYIGSPVEKKVFEVTEAGDWVSTYDVSGLELVQQLTMLFAPSRDQTDDPNRMNLFILDGGQMGQAGKSGTMAPVTSQQLGVSSGSQIVELSLLVATGLPSGTTLLPTTLVRTFGTSSWSNPSTDPSGIDYWPQAGRLIIDDSEVEESVNNKPPVYWNGFNIFHSTLGGNLTGNCTTYTSNPVNDPPVYNNYSAEPSGMAVNPGNNHIFITNDGPNSSVFEVGRGPDGIHCTSDDTVTHTPVWSLYNSTDAEDVAYGNNTVFIADGINAEVYSIPVGANGVLDGPTVVDDGPMNHFDTAVLGFNDLEGIGYNADAGTLFIVSTQGTDRYLGEVTTAGSLVHAYDLSFMGTSANLRSDVAYAPGSQNGTVKNIYIVSRGADNNINRFENDGKVWEVSLQVSIPTSTPTNTPTRTPTPTPTSLSFAQVRVDIGGNNVGNYTIPLQGSIRVTYDLDSGPVKVTSTYNNIPIIVALRDAWLVNRQVTSFAQLMGLPKEQLSDTYYFPAYNNLTLSEQIRIGNVDTVATDVTVKIGGVAPPGGPYHLGPNQSVRLTFPLDTGPVEVKSSGGVKIVAAIRSAWLVNGQSTSFTQLMGLPKEALSDTYYLPAYNNVTLSGQLRIGNVDTSPTTVTVKIGGVTRGTYPLGPNESVRPTYALDAGSVEVKSSGGVKIIAALRDAWLLNGQAVSFAQLMGLPKEKLSDTYLFPAYNNVTLSGQLRFGNVDTSATTVTVKIGGAVQGTYPLNPNESLRPTYNLDAGPVEVKSSGGVKIIAALRDAWLVNGQWTSFTQLMGLPKEALSTTYYLPAYNNVTLSGQLRIGVP